MLESFEIFPSKGIQKDYLVEKITIQYKIEGKSILDEDKKLIENTFRHEIFDFEIIFSHFLSGSRIIEKLENICESFHQKFPSKNSITYLSCIRFFSKNYSGTRRINIYF